MVFVSHSQFSELQVFVNEQCHLDIPSSDCYSAAMGERGFTLLHLIQKLSDQQEYVGQWHDHLNFIATYHRSAVAEGFDKFIQGHTAPSLYISNELENVQMIAPASPRPPTPQLNECLSLPIQCKATQHLHASTQQ